MNKKILVVDDNEIERTILSCLLENNYNIIAASSGEEALELLTENFNAIYAVVLDIIMPGIDGFEVMRKMRENTQLHQIPIIVTTVLDDDDARKKAIAYGANGFVTKPYNQDLLLHSINNAIKLQETAAMVNTVWRDNLTGLLNRESFFVEAERLIKKHEPGYYVLSCFDIENFKLVNYQYGTDKGDEVLLHIANSINDFVANINGLTCRFMADKFAILYPTSWKDSYNIAQNHTTVMTPQCIGRKIRIRIGRYIVTDTSISVSAMYDRASLAGASIKGKYDTYIAEYNDSMLDTLLLEQKIINEMSDALNKGQFVPWYQPQYNHATGALIGAEALVRWIKDGKLVPPNDFIPIFERTGFIYTMDQCIWKQVCAQLRRWIDENKLPLPVSVNISRYDILQEDFVQVICGLVQEYNIPVDLLRLEITESAFSESASTLIRIVKELVEYGFTVEIDDFGSGYSSLNTLKDVPADILKLDMRFLEDTDDSKRGGSILESVVRMAKWLGMSVIAEGVEDKVHADYLKSIGCYYIQGYFYAKPMPLDEYEVLLEREEKEPKLSGLNTLDTLNSNEFWNPKSMETLIFNSYVGGASIIEYHNGIIEPLRLNERFSQEFGEAFIDGVLLSQIEPEKCMDEENLRIMHNNIENAIKTNKESTCEICVSGLDSETIPVVYMRCTLRVIAWTNDRYLLYCVINNVTAQRLAEQKERGMNAELLDNLPCGAGLYEYDGKNLTAIYLNRQYWELVGRKNNKHEGSNALEIVHPDDRDALLPEISDALLQKRDAVCDMRILHGEKDEYRKFHVVIRIRQKSNEKYSLYAFFLPSSDNSLLLEEQNKSRREKNRLEFIFKNAAISVWNYNIKTGKITQNERSRQMHGFDSVVDDVPECLIRSGFVHPDSVVEYRAMYQKLKNGEKEVEGVFRVKNVNRSGYWFEHIRYAAISGSSNSPELFFGISTDVSAEFEQDNAIRQWMALVSEMQVENNVLCEFNLTKNVFVRKQGNLFPPFEFSKTDSFDSYILAWIHENVYTQDAEKIIDFLNRDKLLAMHERGVLDGGIDYRAVIDNEIKWCSVSIKFIEYPADNDVRLIMVHTDINERKKDELRLFEESRHDALTGVLNRKAFEQQVNSIIAEDLSSAHALFMIDLDNFKTVNDNFGHIVGDNVLKKTADSMYSLLRGDDLIGRIGGDEFMLFLKNMPNRDVIAQRAQMILDMLHTVIDKDMQISGSLGIAIAPKDGNTFEKLYSSADKAAYYSKQHGKDCFTFYKPNLDTDILYGEVKKQIDFESDAAIKAWDKRTKQIMEENQHLIEHQEEDERYRIVIESTHIVTFEWNALTGKFSASPEFSQYVISKQSGEQFFSEKVDVSGIHPDDRALFYGKFLEKVLSGESAQETSLRLELKSGGYRWCRIGALVFFDKAEQLQKAIGIITAENAQKNKSDVQLDAIFKYMSAGVMLLEIKKPNITALYISESYFRLENTTELTVSYDDALCDVHCDDYARLKDNLYICSMSGAVMEENFRVVHNNKTSWRHMHALRIPYPDAQNPVMIAVETDITDIKRREITFEKQQSLIAAVLHEMNIISWYYYPDKKLAVMNTTSARAANLDPRVKNVPECFIADGTVHYGDANTFLEMHKRIDSGEKTVSAIVRIKLADGSFSTRKIAYISILDEDCKPYCAIGISEPINLK